MGLVFSASPLPFEEHLVWPQIRAYIFAHQSPQSLHLAFIEAVDSDTCLQKSSAENRLNRISLEKPASGSSLASFVLLPEDAQHGSCLVNWRFHLTSLSFCSVLLAQCPHPCHLQESPKIVRGIPVGGTLLDVFFLHCFSLKFLPPCLGMLQCLHGVQVIDTAIKSRNKISTRFEPLTSNMLMKALFVSLYYKEVIVTIN